MDLKEYEECCWIYGRILCNPAPDHNVLIHASQAFHEAHILCLDAGHEVLELKNILKQVLFTLNLESDDSDHTV